MNNFILLGVPIILSTCLYGTCFCSTCGSGPCIEGQPTAVTQVPPHPPALSPGSSFSSSLRPPSPPLHLPTFPNVPVRGALELPGTQQEAGPVVGVALAASGGAEPPRGRAALVPEDLVDGGAVLVGQRCVSCRLAILLGIWEKGIETWGVEGRGGETKREEGR